MAKLAALSLVSCASLAHLAVAAPLIHTDVFHSTVELFGDLYSTAYRKLDMDSIAAKLPKDDVMKVVNEQLSAVPPEITKALSEAKVMATQVRATVSTLAEQAHAEADKHAKAVVELIEAKLPAARKGMIAASAGGLVMFSIWMLLGLYLQFRCLKFVLYVAYSLTWLFWCGICCCRLCRSKKAKATNGAATSKAKAKAAPANGKTNGAAKAAPAKKK